MNTVHWQFLRFSAVGLSGLLINLAITHVGVSVFGFWYFTSFLSATLVGWTFVFLVNAVHTFPEHKESRTVKRYALFLIGYAGIFLINSSLVFLLTSGLSVHYLISISVSSGITAVLSFVFSKRVVYVS